MQALHGPGYGRADSAALPPMQYALLTAKECGTNTRKGRSLEVPGVT